MTPDSPAPDAPAHGSGPRRDAAHHTLEETGTAQAGTAQMGAVPPGTAPRRRGRTGCVGCLGCLGCGGLLLLVLAVVSAVVGPSAFQNSTSATATSSSASPSSSPSGARSSATASSAAVREALAKQSSASSSPASASPSPYARPSSATPRTADGTALALLGTLEVKGRAPKTGYSRDQFGQAWADTDHNGCDTRNDVLRRDLTSVVTRPGTHGCKVSTGTLSDPYTGTSIAFTAGRSTSRAVQIDHMVALSDAWQTGAQQLSADEREELANDPLNLLAVDGPTNESKGDGDAATWLPSNAGFRCSYVARQVAVKHKYRLWVTQAEHDAIARVLDGCRDQKAPSSTPVPLADDSEENAAAEPTQSATATAAPAAPAQQAPAQQNAPAQQEQAVSYGTCADVRAAGAAPLRAGSPGYSRRLDRDGDGVACEG